MLLSYWEKRSLTTADWRGELHAMGIAPDNPLEELARLMAAQGQALVSCYRFQAPMGEAGVIVVCHDLGRGLISLGPSSQWGKWDADYEVLTLDESGEKYDFEGHLVYEGDSGSCSLGNF